jgi:hypothetical protein
MTDTYEEYARLVDHMESIALRQFTNPATVTSFKIVFSLARHGIEYRREINAPDLDPIVLARVEAVLDVQGQGDTAQTAHRKVGMYARTTVKKALTDLVKAGRARRELDGVAYRHWRVEAA